MTATERLRRLERMHGVNEALRVVEEYGKVEVAGADPWTVRFAAQARQTALVAALKALASSLGQVTTTT